MMYEATEEQEDAVRMLEPGRILFGPTGVGKTYAALLYYVRYQSEKPLIVITTAVKRNKFDWQTEATMLNIRSQVDGMDFAYGPMKVDSWNNIKKYIDVKDAFFIFDEQRVVGRGTWAKSFMKIAENNDWIMLSATPGDTWMDYAAVFVANGFFKNVRDFEMKHVVYKPFLSYPQILRYENEGRLQELRNEILVEMPNPTVKPRNNNVIVTTYDHDAYDTVIKKRWDPLEQKPIETVARAYYLARMIMNADVSRVEALRELMKMHPRLIVFYTFNYELDILRSLANEEQITYGEMNGFSHDALPDDEFWLYFVQYTSGSEGWNCIETDAMVFYSMPYSYRMFHQAHGRIDRRNNPARTLYYYVLTCQEGVDKQIERALNAKRNFNEGAWKDLEGVWKRLEEV